MKIQKALNEYRLGDWKSNFKYLNYQNVSASLKKILTTKEPKKIYDRLGNHVSGGRVEPLSLDETIFRIMALLDTQMEDFVNSNIPLGDYEKHRAESKAIVHNLEDQ